MGDRYSRQMILREIGEKGQKRLAKSSVLVVGLGALGSVSSNILVRVGVGRVVLLDRDYVELNNLQRQVLFDEGDVGLPKAVAAKNKLERINSLVDIESLITDLNSTNAEEILKDIDLILDGTDNLETRFLINDVSIKNKIPWISASCISTYGMTFNIVPRKTPCFRCIIPSLPPVGSLETCETAGILNTVPVVIASIQSTEAIKILLGEVFSKKLCMVNMWENTIDFLEVKLDKNCETCQKRNFEFLKGKHAYEISRLCGINTFQLKIPMKSVDFNNLAKKLQRVGHVIYNPYILYFKVDQKTLALFKTEGRVIVKGVKDEKEAKSLCSRYIG